MDDYYRFKTPIKTAASTSKAALEEKPNSNGSGPNGAAPQSLPAKLDGMEQIALHDKVIEVLHTCYDPEIPVDIYELGLVYEVKVEPTAEVYLKMTLTTPNCPAAVSLPDEIREKVRAMPEVTDVKLEIVWEPMWEPSKMSEAARLQLGFF